MKPLNEKDWPRLVKPGSRVFIGGGAAVPLALVRSLLAHADQLCDIEMVHIHGLGETPWIDPQYGEVIRANSFFLTPSLREAVERGQADYTPCSLSEIPQLFRSGAMPLDVALIQVSPATADGRHSLGVSVDVALAAATHATLVIAQINPRMPRTAGDALLPAERIDWFIEHEAALPEMSPPLLDSRHDKIGRYAAQLIEDGATLQVGLGNSPEAVLRALRKHHHLGIHSGIFNDALMELVRCGAADHSLKSYRPGKIIASHVMGSAALYQFVDGNPDLEMHPSDWVNDPVRIARNERMVAINGAVEIDLTGQVVRDSSGHLFHGGIGALQDFIRGAGRSRGGRPIIVLPSTVKASGKSRIVAGLESGSGVCTGRGDVHYVVTEYGVASLHGRNIRERVAQLVEIAHPDHRESLLEGARVRGWLPKFFTMPSFAPQVNSNGVESAWVSFSGERFFFRPLYPSDMHALQEFFYSHNAETIRLRYGYHRDRMSGESAYKLAAVDQRRDLALGLFAAAGGGRLELRAIGRYYLEEDGRSAEVAFVVHENTRGLGMSAFLLVELARVAERRGVAGFWAGVLPANRAMAAVFAASGGTEDRLPQEEDRHFQLPVATVLAGREALLAQKQIEILER